MKETAYICAHWNKYNRKFEYAIFGYEPSDSSGYILIEDRELEFLTPNDNKLRVLATKVLQNKKNKIIADAHVVGVAIDEEIQEMLAIEDKSTKNELIEDEPF